MTDQHRVVFRDFMQAVFDVYGVLSPIPDSDRATAEREIPVPLIWFMGQECTLRTDKARTELGYVPVVSQAEGLAVLRDHVHAGAVR